MRILAVITAVMIMIVSGGLCGAHAQEKPDMANNAATEMGMSANAMEAMSAKGKDGPMMHGMMGKSIVATSDGGVVVMIGNKLFKYDGNLELKKEAEIPVDREAMQRMMEKMKAQCPAGQMMGDDHMMKSGRMQSAEPSSKSR